jgi:aminopeptidase-like protein
LYVGDLSRDQVMQIMYILQYSDGMNDLIDIAERIGLYIANFEEVINILKKHQMIKN